MQLSTPEGLESPFGESLQNIVQVTAEQGGKTGLHWFKMASGAKFAQFNGWTGRGDYLHAGAGDVKSFFLLF